MKKVVSIFLSFLILISGMGFTVSTHFCGGIAVESALNIGKEHLDCGMKNMNRNSPNHTDGTTTITDACCANEYTSYDIEDEYQTTASKVVLDNDFLFAFVFSDVFPVIYESNNYQSYLCYIPPPLIEDLPILHQSFLI